ncbi:glycosyltransferase family 2 protein [Cryomorpha ignava]|uniref:Glycosyltransferase family 2 protein n=1 Tax=Cryomorpha ignava TaxID=101383 RepID=A0A7K3WV83_9FLAO|nr:glycosyltransferase family 2 protein [Cryomorpha ignava]NEN24822.1 glycosyltransferase family 2 protein [Cryomorpha ignava]
MKISAVIITYNEERNIERCLNSLSGVADEIIIVDSFSTDKTADLCRKFDVNFVQHPFADFAAQKNFGNSLTENKFVLSLDADEALSESLRESIINWKTNSYTDALQINRLTNYCGKWIKHGGWYPDAKYRLFDKAKARWTGEKVHEYLEIDNDAVKGKLNGDLFHYSFYTIEQHLTTINKYSTLKAEINFEKGKKASLFKILFAPWFKFLKIYFLKAAFRDGWRGFVIAKNSAYSDFLKHAKLRQMELEN